MLSSNSVFRVSRTHIRVVIPSTILPQDRSRPPVRRIRVAILSHAEAYPCYWLTCQGSYSDDGLPSRTSAFKATPRRSHVAGILARSHPTLWWSSGEDVVSSSSSARDILRICSRRCAVMEVRLEGYAVGYRCSRIDCRVSDPCPVL